MNQDELWRVFWAWFALLGLCLLVIEIVTFLDRLAWRLIRAIGWLLYVLYAPMEWLCITILRWALLLGLLGFWFTIFVNTTEVREIIRSLR
jgi:hypothetical protein